MNRWLACSNPLGHTAGATIYNTWNHMKLALCTPNERNHSNSACRTQLVYPYYVTSLSLLIISNTLHYRYIHWIASDTPKLTEPRDSSHTDSITHFYLCKLYMATLCCMLLWSGRLKSLIKILEKFFYNSDIKTNQSTQQLLSC